MPMLASEDLQCEHKKYSVRKHYPSEYYDVL